MAGLSGQLASHVEDDEDGAGDGVVFGSADGVGDVDDVGGGGSGEVELGREGDGSVQHDDRIYDGPEDGRGGWMARDLSHRPRQDEVQGQQHNSTRGKHQSQSDNSSNNNEGKQNREKKQKPAQQQKQQQSAVADLIFSSAQSAGHQFNHILTALKRANLSMHNRLLSVQADAEFVQRVQRAYFCEGNYVPPSLSSPLTSSPSSSPLVVTDRADGPRPRPRPLIANERCGSWYIPPHLKQGSAYFKSTDGHFGIWSFSTRRLNLQLLGPIGESDGCIVVDSTRRGKRMPDALSKTVPMWCCVLNWVLFPEGVKRKRRARGISDGDDGKNDEQYEQHKLYTPPNAVSASEHAQMESRVQGHVEAFKKLGLDLAPYRKMLSKPLRPVWVTQESHLDGFGEEEEGDDGDEDGGPAGSSAGDGSEEGDTRTKIKGVTVFDDFHPVICCTSSRRVVGGEMSEGGYIQGAGDDTENWAFGLTPPIFWANTDLLLSTPEADLPDLVRSLVAQADTAPTPHLAQATETTGLSSSPQPPPPSHPGSSHHSWLSKHQQVAPGIFVARTADLDPSQLQAAAQPRDSSSSGDDDGIPPPPPPPVYIITIDQSTATDPKTWQISETRMAVGLGGKQSKIASRNLRAALPTIAELVGAYLEQIPGTTTSASPPTTSSSSPSSPSSAPTGEAKILIACTSGRDISVGVALALVCQHCTNTTTTTTATTTSGSASLTFRPRSSTDGVNKTLIKSRLGHIMTLFSDANPSRATLQSVNSYLMG